MRRTGDPGARKRRSRLANGFSRASETVQSLPGAGRVISELLRVEFIDRTVVVAAQSLFALVPLIMVAGAFAPEAVRDSMISQFGGVMAIPESAMKPMTDAVSAEQIRTQTGLVGMLVVLVSASSFARSLQRLFEKTWEQPHRGGLPGVRRSLGWMVACVAYVQALVLVLSILRGFPGSSVLRITTQVTLSALLWWWSAHVLLEGRVRWRMLWPAALLTGAAMAALTHGSQVVMPPYVQSNVDQFGPLGVVFAASTWLLAFGAAIVIAGVLGRVIVEEPALQRIMDLPSRLHVSRRGASTP
jgi:membrane protein